MGTKDSESFAALFEQSGGAKQKMRFRTGEKVEVSIVAIGRDAVFADLGGKQEGYFERPDLADADGNLTVAIGARVSAVVAEVDDRAGQVRLSPVFVRRSDAAEPMNELSIPISSSGPLLVEGARVSGKVTGVERYGVFVQIDATKGRGGRGLVPTAETGTPRGADLKKHFAVGQPVEAKILAIGEDGKIRLSMKALADDLERRDYESFMAGAEPKEGAAAPPAPEKGAKPKKPEPRGFGTLGDLLKKK